MNKIHFESSKHCRQRHRIKSHLIFFFFLNNYRKMLEVCQLSNYLLTP